MATAYTAGKLLKIRVGGGNTILPVTKLEMKEVVKETTDTTDSEQVAPTQQPGHTQLEITLTCLYNATTNPFDALGVRAGVIVPQMKIYANGLLSTPTVLDAYIEDVTFVAEMTKIQEYNVTIKSDGAYTYMY
jgi:hypothetical protein